ncbi:BglG family transcription antiterminator [Enterococcus termitis]|uniref:DNA-binding protein n=1 Tax=Enterococcus termitis TaxID=332950 RepID=A0A1E5GW28_9ENTE|nr:PRD domain-containing protein [Enterococcus termitis]OEG16908.1 DNA-binding protein [Enterococcus termitis]OJG99627.1 hypothetical protein RV18_GL001695 [Enterococcus termitis]
MQLSKRELVIIDLFLKHDLSLTANQLAYFTNVSTKTIYRTVKKINDQSDSGDLIISEPSKGFVLDYDRFLKENAKVGRGIQTTDPLERRNSVMLRLLFKAPNKVDIHYLFEPFYVSDAAVSGDIQRITEYLKTYHLQVKRSQKKLSIEGAERNIRKAVLSIIAKDNLIDDVFTIDGQLMNAYDIDFLTSLLDFIDKMLKTSITYPYNVNIFSHLYILVQRTREGKILFSEERFLLDSEEEELIKKNQELYSLACIVIDRIEGYLATPLPTNERFFLFQYLISSRIENHSSHMIEEPDLAKTVAKDFLEIISVTLGIELAITANIQDLKNHIAPLLYRLKNEIIVKNGLLNDISLEYPDMFETVKETARIIEKRYDLISISDDEVGFLTLYFVKYREMINHQKRILIMCSSGVGTSELLKVKVSRAFPDINIVDVLSSRKYQNNIDDYKNIDLILTTIHLKENPNIPTILVNSIFTKQDEERVKEFLGGL